MYGRTRRYVRTWVSKLAHSSGANLDMEITLENEDRCKFCGASEDEHCKECWRCDDGSLLPVLSLPKFICEYCIENIGDAAGMEYNRHVSLDRWLSIANGRIDRGYASKNYNMY